MSNLSLSPDNGHTKPRYTFNRVCMIFGIHRDTLYRWLRDGVPLANGQRIKMHFIPVGKIGKEFEVDEIERVYQAMRASSIENVIIFPDEEDRPEHRSRGEARRLNRGEDDWR